MCVEETEQWVAAQKDLTQRWKTFFSMSHRHKHVKSLQIHEKQSKSEPTSLGGMWNGLQTKQQKNGTETGDSDG